MSNAYYEDDYRPISGDVRGRFIAGSGVEVIRELGGRRPPKHVLFDFDGTLSLIREGWMNVMAPMMVEILTDTGTSEPVEVLDSLAREFIMELNGKQTIYQMIRLAEEVRRRGGQPKEPLEYKQIYHDRLMRRIAGRLASLERGDVSPDEMLVPYSRQILDALREGGAALYVASGTDEKYVREEVRLLGLDRYFGRRVYGALDDYKTFSKAMVIERILRENNVPGELLLGFGDGYVEIQNVKAAGGTAVAVASDETQRSGLPDAWKRTRLIGAGADVVIPDYKDFAILLDYLGLHQG